MKYMRTGTKRKTYRWIQRGKCPSHNEGEAFPMRKWPRRQGRGILHTPCHMVFLNNFKKSLNICYIRRESLLLVFLVQVIHSLLNFALYISIVFQMSHGSIIIYAITHKRSACISECL